MHCGTDNGLMLFNLFYRKPSIPVKETGKKTVTRVRSTESKAKPIKRGKITIHEYVSYLSSSEPKAQVRFFDQNLSVICKLLKNPLRSPWQILSNS